MFALKLPSQIKAGSSQTAYVAARKAEMLAKQQAEAKAAIAPSPDEKIASPITKAAIAAAAAQRLKVSLLLGRMEPPETWTEDEWSSVRTVAGAKAGDDSKDAAPDSSQRPAAAVAAAASPPPPPPPQEAAPPSPAKPLSWAERAKKNAPPQAIHKACQGGHLELVKWLAQQDGVSLMAEDHYGWQPIHSACFNGHLEVVKWLADEDGVSLTARRGRLGVHAEDNDGSQPIHCACDKGHLEVVKWLAQQDGVSLMAEDNDGWQPIQFTCSNGHLEVVKWLAARDGVSLTVEAKNGSQPIHEACTGGHLELVKWLQQQDGVSLMAEDNYGSQPIHRACDNGHLEVVKWLAQQDGVSLTAATKVGWQPIHNACGKGHLEVVKWLAGEDGVSLTAATKVGSNSQPIHRACDNGHLEVVKWLAQQDGVSLTAATKVGWQPIHNACGKGHLEVVKWLAGEDGVSLMAEDNDGSQPIHRACDNGHLEVVKWLAQQDGVSLTAATKVGSQPIHFACGKGHLEVVMWLAEQHGVSLTAATKVGSQPIHIACIRGQLEVVKWLAEQHGVSLMTENNDGLQPIHYACSNRHLKVVKWLAARDGVSLTAEAKNGSQPIHVACQGGHLELVKWLQQHYEVSLTAEAHNGWQPIHSACFNGHLEVVKWLADEDGVSLTAEDNDGSQPIHCACDNGHLEVVKWLAQQDGGKCGGLELDEATGCLVHLWEMEDGVSLMAENNDGWQPIHYACSNGHLEVVKWLAARDGVSLTAEDNDGWQPIHYACSNGHLEVVKWLAQQDGVSLMAEDNDGLQPIHYAGDLELVKWLAEQDGVSLPYPMNQGHEWPLFILRTAAITTYIIPFILGQKPSTTPVFDKVKFAVKMIAERKLDPNYYPSQRALADALGEANKFAIDMKFLFVERFRAKELSLLLGMDVYKPSDGMSGVFNLEITPELTLTAPLDGVTPNRDCVVLINKYYKFANGRVRNELKCVITGVMAVWRARRGIVVLDKTKEVLDFKFEPEFWKVISDRLKTWARQKSMLIREEAKRQGKSGLSEDMLRAAGLDRPLPARNDDERTVTSISTTLSQVSVNECMHASERAVERQIRTSDIQNAKKSGVIWLQIPFNYENDTDAEGTRAENTIQDWGRRLVEAFGLTRKFGLTLGSCLCRGNAQDRRFELELAGSESQGKNIKEWLKDESYFECGRRMQYAWRQNDWELVVVEGQIDLEPESRYSEEVVVGVITSMWRQIHDTGQENCHRHIAAAVGIRNGGSAEAGGVEEAGADVHEDYQLLSDSQKQGQSEYKKQGPQYGHVSLAAPKGGGGRDKAAEKAGRPAQASQATRGPALPAHVVRMMQDWSWEGKALRR